MPICMKPAADIAARAAYEEDCRRKPVYHDGRPRPAWESLGAIAKESWALNPTAREYPAPICQEIDILATVIRNGFSWGIIIGGAAILAFH